MSCVPIDLHAPQSYTQTMYDYIPQMLPNSFPSLSHQVPTEMPVHSNENLKSIHQMYLQQNDHYHVFPYSPY